MRQRDFWRLVAFPPEPPTIEILMFKGTKLPTDFLAKAVHNTLARWPCLDSVRLPL